MDRTESLSKLNLSNISLSSIKNRTLTRIAVLPNGHLRFDFNRGEPVLLERNMNSVPILNYIESIEVRPFTLTIRTKDGRYLIRLIGAAGISSASTCYGKYRLFNLTNNTALGYSPCFYAGQSMIYESSAADFSIETLIEADGTQLQLQFRCSVNCRLGANVDWGHRNTLVVTKLD